MRRCAAVFVLLVLWAAAASAAVAGRVIAPDGSPVPGATVSGYAPETGEQAALRILAGRTRTLVATGLSGSDGVFRLEARLPLLTVEARASGFAPAFTATAGDHPVTVWAAPADIKRAVVTAGGKPIAGALVVWTAGSITGAAAELMVRTAADGSYDVPDPRAWAHDGVVLHPDFAPRDLSPYQFGERAQELDVGSAIDGTVVDGDGRPIAGATLWAGGRKRWPLARSGDDGAFRIAHGPRSWQMLSARSGALVGSVDRSSGPIAIIVRPGRSLSGLVRDENGRPLSGALLTTRDRGWSGSAVSDAQGRYAVDGLLPGRYRAQAVRPGFEVEEEWTHGFQTTDLTTAPSGRRDFVLTRLAIVSGRVEDETRRPIANALVTFGYKGAPNAYVPSTLRDLDREARSAADGSFTITIPRLRDGTDDLLKDRPLIVLKAGYAAGRVEARSFPPKGAGRLIVTLGRGIELKGRVTSVEGTPVAGVEVTLVEDGTEVGGLRSSRWTIGNPDGGGWTVSDADGRFSVRVHPVVHHLAFRKTGHAPKVVPSHDPRAGALEVVLEPGARLGGRVAQPGGRGVAGVDVAVSRPTGGDLARLRTSGDGRFEFSGLAPGKYDLRVHDNDRGIAQTRTVEVPGPNIQVLVGAAGTVRGRVVDAATRRPVSAFWVALEWRAEEHTAEGNREKDVRDPAGAFVWADVPAREVSVTVSAAGYVGRTLGGISVPADGPMPVLEIALEADVPIRGRVTSEGQTGIPHAHVVARTTAGALVGSGTSDDEGRFELRGVAPGEVTLTFIAPGFLPASRTVDTRQVTVVEVALDRGLALRGEVVFEGAGVPDAVVGTGSGLEGPASPTTHTDEHGRFTLEGLAPGRHTVTAFARGKGRATASNVDVESSGPLRLVIERPQTAVLSGRVVGLVPADLTAVVVNARNEESGAGASARVGADMTFRMEAAPVGRVRVTAYANTTAGSTRAGRTVELFLAPGATAETTVEFTSDVVAGRVTRNGQPVPDVYVSFTTPGRFRASGRTDAGGRYEAVGLEPGRYTVQVSGNGVVFSTEHTVAGPGSFDIDITAAAPTLPSLKGAIAPRRGRRPSSYRTRLPCATSSRPGRRAASTRSLPCRGAR